MRDGYLALEPGAEDRRERRIVLTPQGQSKYREARALWQAAQDEFLAVYGAGPIAKVLRAALLDIAYDAAARPDRAEGRAMTQEALTSAPEARQRPADG